MAKASAKKKEVELHTCGECANVIPVKRFTTLTVNGRRPTLGECPYWTESRCVLLSMRTGCKHFRKKL